MVYQVVSGNSGRVVGKALALVLVLVGCGLTTGCSHFNNSTNDSQLQSYPAPDIEAAWIRNGDPIVYAGESWYPVPDVENMTDSEVYQVGEYKDVQIFVDKIDIKPYGRLYTKFAKNKFRYYERRTND